MRRRLCSVRSVGIQIEWKRSWLCFLPPPTLHLPPITDSEKLIAFLSRCLRIDFASTCWWSVGMAITRSNFIIISEWNPAVLRLGWMLLGALVPRTYWQADEDMKGVSSFRRHVSFDFSWGRKCLGHIWECSDCDGALRIIVPCFKTDVWEKRD